MGGKGLVVVKQYNCNGTYECSELVSSAVTRLSNFASKSLLVMFSLKTNLIHRPKELVNIKFPFNSTYI